MEVPPTGPTTPGGIMIVGEAPGASEEKRGIPFIGQSGMELNRMLIQAGIDRSKCRITNAVRQRPPGNKLAAWFGRAPGGKRRDGPFLNEYPNDVVKDGVQKLWDEVDKVRPNVIIAFGNASLWALTGEWGITKWRGSIIPSVEINGRRYKVVPTYHPAAILRQWSWRQIALFDLKRARTESETAELKEPEWNFILRPGYDQVMDTLERLKGQLDGGEKLRLAADLETRLGHIACLGIAWSETEAICIPFMDTKRPEGYWDYEEECDIVLKLRELFHHPNSRWIGQNWLYDAQYTAVYWGVEANLEMDTMIAHHVCFAGLPKSLDFMATIYCDQPRYWKDEGKEWNPDTMDEERLWKYNCLDAVRTYECAQEILELIEKQGLRDAYLIQMSLFRPVLYMMLRGVKVDKNRRSKLYLQLMDEMAKRREFLNRILEQDFNPNSPAQVQKLFYDEFGLKPYRNRKTGRPSADEEALKRIGEKSPFYGMLVDAILQYRQLGKALSVINQPFSHDGRMRCSYIIPGTDTFRFASQKDAFGFGTNLQNLSKGTEKEAEKEEAETGKKPEFVLPNIRRLLIPDRGYSIIECDLPQADAQVVAWDAGAKQLKEILKDPEADLHSENARLIFGKTKGFIGRLPYRYLAKRGVHATNYGATPRTLAISLGITVREAEEFQDAWFTANPEIYDWQQRILMDLQRKRYIENPFGYRKYYFDRIENAFKEALSWIPQSTVAICTNLGLRKVDEELRDVHVLMQCHDSGIQQAPTARLRELVPEILRCYTVEIPYEDPLIMPPGAEVSDKSWGDVEEYAA